MTVGTNDDHEAPWGRAALRHPRRHRHSLSSVAHPPTTVVAAVAVAALAVALVLVWRGLGDGGADAGGPTGYSILSRQLRTSDGWAPGANAAGAGAIPDARLAYDEDGVTVHVHRGRGDRSGEICMIVRPGPSDRDLCAPFGDDGGAQLYATRTVGDAGDDLVVVLVPDIVDRVVVGDAELVPDDNLVVVQRPGAFTERVALFAGAEPVELASYLRYERPATS
ncbi:MAG: hypothetical protein S0880_23555 [Actinomycetota bacterium]|nr:hypothetical protein [Actinomycetota bacterium]